MKFKILSLIICMLLAACASPTEESPTAIPTPELVVTSDIPYTSEMTLDVYAPAEPGSYPVVVAFHGGSLTKLSFKKLGTELAGKGVVVFAIDWHSNPPISAEEYLLGWEDAACAVRFARQFAAEYQGAPSRIIVIGHSAGGAVGAAITLAGDQFSGDCLAEEGSALADGFVGLDGGYPILNYISNTVKEEVPEDVVNQIDPFYALANQHAREDVEFILFVGDEAEDLVTASEDFYQALIDRGYPAELIYLPDTSHTAIINFPRPESVEAIIHLAYGE